MTIPNLKITRTAPTVHMPTTATTYSIGADVYAHIPRSGGGAGKLVFPSKTTRLVPTGIVAVAEPPYSILVASRSGLAINRQLFVLNSPGIIDPDYRGEIKIMLHNAGHETQWITDGDRIAQLILVPIPYPIIEESLTDLRNDVTERGSRGFGSTGA